MRVAVLYASVGILCLRGANECLDTHGVFDARVFLSLCEFTYSIVFFCPFDAYAVTIVQLFRL